MVAKDGRLKPGDQILEVYIISSQNIHIYNFLDDVKKLLQLSITHFLFTSTLRKNTISTILVFISEKQAFSVYYKCCFIHEVYFIGF